jgi:hypothetical protein
MVAYILIRPTQVNLGPRYQIRMVVAGQVQLVAMELRSSLLNEIQRMSPLEQVFQDSVLSLDH